MEAQLVPLVAVSAAVEWDSFSVRNLNRFSAGCWEDWEEAEMAADVISVIVDGTEQFSFF